MHREKGEGKANTPERSYQPLVARTSPTTRRRDPRLGSTSTSDSTFQRRRQSRAIPALAAGGHGGELRALHGEQVDDERTWARSELSSTLAAARLRSRERRGCQGPGDGNGVFKVRRGATVTRLRASRRASHARQARSARRRPRGFGYGGEGASDVPGPPISETRPLTLRTGKRPPCDRELARARWEVWAGGGFVGGPN